MTLINGKEFKCSRCGDTFSTVIHDSINVSMLPHLKEEFLSGKLNQAVCPQCNTAYSVANAVLYHDMNNGVMIHVLLTEEYSNDRERAIKEFTGIMRENISSLGGTMRKNFERYKFDIVFSIDELRESLDSMAGVCSEKVKAITENDLRLEPNNITRERPHTIDSRFKLGIKKQEAICDKCGTSFESSPKQSFLGFLLFTCPKCAKKITHPLRKKLKSREVNN